MRKFAVIMVFAVVLMVANPLSIAKNLQLGGYAKSPQEATIRLGQTVTVAGGRAHIWYAGGDTGGDFEIKCKDESRYIQPEKGEVYEGCKVRVSLIDIKEPKGRGVPKAKFRIEWDQKAQ